MRRRRGSLCGPGSEGCPSKETVRRSTPVAPRGCPQQGNSGSLAMHLSPEFTQDSALAAAVGGMGIGAVATIFAQTNQRLLPSATPDAEVWTGMVAGAFALVSNPFFALVDGAFEGDSLQSLGLGGDPRGGPARGRGFEARRGLHLRQRHPGPGACLSKASFGLCWSSWPRGPRRVPGRKRLRAIISGAVLVAARARVVGIARRPVLYAGEQRKW